MSNCGAKRVILDLIEDPPMERDQEFTAKGQERRAKRYLLLANGQWLA